MNDLIKRAKDSPSVDLGLLQESLCAFKELRRSGNVTLKGYELATPFSQRPIVKSSGSISKGTTDPRTRLVHAMR